MAEERERASVARTIAELKDAEPFVPFRIVMTSGDKYVIQQSNNFVEMRSEYFYALPDGESFVLLRKNQIAAIEKRTQNGRSRRRRAS
jgi:hypothetical protein